MKLHRNARRHDAQAATIAARRIRCGRRGRADWDRAAWIAAKALVDCDAQGCSNCAPLGTPGWTRLPGTSMHVCSDGCMEALFEQLGGPRPRTRGDCVGGPRPCPWVRCKWHLYLDTDPDTGALRLAFPDLEVWELEQTCALDVADGGVSGPLVVGQRINMTRERVRQVARDAMRKVIRLRDQLDDGRKTASGVPEAAGGGAGGDEDDDGVDAW